MVTVDAHFEKGGEKEEGQKQIWTERSRGRLSRCFTLAKAIDESRAEARFENGVLTLKLPKRAADGSRRLTIA
jgi:HSP20 family protein